MISAWRESGPRDWLAPPAPARRGESALLEAPDREMSGRREPAPRRPTEGEFSWDSWLRPAQKVTVHARHTVHVPRRRKAIASGFSELPQRMFGIPQCLVVQTGIEICIKLCI